jgi:hypothetical protein
MAAKDAPPKIGTVPIAERPADVEERWWRKVANELGLTLEEFDTWCALPAEARRARKAERET